MPKADLLVCCAGDLHADFRKVLRFIGTDRETERLRIRDHEAVAAISCVDGKGADALDLQLRIELVREGGYVADGDPFGLAGAACSCHLDEPARCFKGE